MKKLVTVVLALAMALSIGACGKAASIQDYLDKPAVKTQMDAQIKEVEAQGMKAEVLGEDNKLIYRFTVDMVVDDVETVKAALESGVEAQKAQFEEAASSLKKEVKVDNPVVVVEYLDANGTELYKAEIPAK